MLLKDNLLKLGNFLFKHRGFQFILYFLVAGLSWKHFFLTKDNLLLELICIFIAFVGMLVRAYTVGFVTNGTSGRNSTKQIAEELNITGMYSIVRNPLYVGNFLIFLGVILLTQDIKTIVIVSILYWLFYIPIILTEENFLLDKFKDKYIKYSQNVPCLIPSFKNFVKPCRPFSFNMVLVREQDTLFTTALLLLTAETIMEYAQVGKFHVDRIWIITFIMVMCAYAVLKYMKKHHLIYATELSK